MVKQADGIVSFTAMMREDHMAKLMTAFLGGMPPRRHWWHRFLIRLGFTHRGPYVHTFTADG